MRIRLVTDSTCDLSPDYLAKRGIYFEALKVLFGKEEYADKIDLDADGFYGLMRESSTLPTTSQVNPAAFEKRFLEVLQQGEQILGLFISSELSGTYSAAAIAKLQIEEMHPEYLGKISLLDSRTTSFGLGLLVIAAQDLIDSGAPIQAVEAAMHPLIGQQQLYGMLSNLENLVKGGRLSAGSAFIGNLLNVKPIIEVLEGKVQVANKARGANKGMQWMVSQLEASYPSKVIPLLAYAHASSPERLESLKDLIEKNFVVQKSYVIQIGPVVGTHVGEGAVGIAYFKA